MKPLSESFRRFVFFVALSACACSNADSPGIPPPDARSASSPPLPENTWVFSQEAVQIDQGQVKTLTVKQDRLIIPGDHSLSSELISGSILVGGDIDTQLLRRVTNLIEEDGQLVAMTKPVALTEAFQELSIDLSRADEIWVQTEEGLNKIQTTKEDAFKDWEESLQVTFNFTPSNQWEVYKNERIDIDLSASLDLKVNLSGSIAIEGGSLKKFTFSSTVDYSVSTEGKAVFEDSLAGERTRTLLESQRLLALRIGPVWINVNGAMDGGFSYQGAIHGSLQVGTLTTGTLEYSGSYTKGLNEPWSVSGTRSLNHENLAPNIDLRGDAHITPYIQPTFDLMLFDLVGLKTRLRGSLLFTARVITTDPGQIYFGGNVGANLSLTLSALADLWGFDPAETTPVTLWDSATIFAECSWAADTSVSQIISAGCCYPGVDPNHPKACLCGDNIITGEEDCDNTFLLGQTCESRGYEEGGTLSCHSGACQFDESLCSGELTQVCGDGEVTGTEQCDGDLLGGQTCEDLGYMTGTLVCDPWTCRFDESLCSNAYGVSAITTGYYHTCVLFDHGAVRCWGRNDYGQLGYGHTNDIRTSLIPNVPLGATAVDISAGYEHTCALLDTGAVRCWGRNRYGELGYGHTNDIGDDEPANVAGDVPLGGTAVAITAGDFHTCALLNTGAVRCWGNGGRLGYGNINDIGDDEFPSSVGDMPLGGIAIAISSFYAHTCALMSSGAIRCWGNNNGGQLGYGHRDAIGDDEPASAAGNVPFGGTALSVSAGHFGTCAVLNSGAVRCWGVNIHGQLGYGYETQIGDDEPASAAGEVPLGGTAVAVDASGSLHTCALLITGAVRCWGSNFFGQLGYENQGDIGDDEFPSSAGDVPFE